METNHSSHWNDTFMAQFQASSLHAVLSLLRKRKLFCRGPQALKQQLDISTLRQSHWHQALLQIPNSILVMCIHFLFMLIFSCFHRSRAAHTTKLFSLCCVVVSGFLFIDQTHYWHLNNLISQSKCRNYFELPMHVNHGASQNCTRFSNRKCIGIWYLSINGYFLTSHLTFLILPSWKSLISD